MLQYDALGLRYKIILFCYFIGSVVILSPLSANSAVVGDIDGDGKIELSESIYALQVAAGVYPTLPESCLLTGKGIWQAGTDYNLCDVVTFNSRTYGCTTTHTSATSTLEPTNTSYWSELSIKGINCWDTNENGTCDLTTEDTDTDGLCSAADCQGSAVLPYIGEIKMFAGSFAPLGWEMCNGQLLDIGSNIALFSIIGTTYGGDGTNTFGLPDLRGRVPMHIGQGTGLTNRSLGQSGGNEAFTLTEIQMPSHGHQATARLDARSGPGNSASPAAGLLAESGDGGLNYHTDPTPNTSMATSAIDVDVQDNGGNQPVSSMPPFLSVNFIIAIEGIYPMRN